MRTTATFDPDVVALIERDMKRRGISFKQALNDAIRAGLASRKSQPRYAMKTRPMGKPLVPLAKALQLAADLEDEEIVRKMSLGK